MNKKSPSKPLSIMTYGPPGTGKSETAKALAKVLSMLGPHKYSEVWTDLNQFTEAHSIHKLIGSPPGYIGYSDKPILEAVTNNPYTVFHWDEADKCHGDVLKLMMSILDEGRCTANKVQSDGTNQLHFEHCIFIFTSNFKLGVPSSTRRIGFSFSEDVESIRHDEAVDINYTKQVTEEKQAAITMRIFRSTESARKAFVEANVLPEIASRFNCFCQFHELSTEAKVKILLKMLIKVGFEYNIRLSHISSSILQSLIDAATSENTLTVRSFRALIEGYLAAAFAEAGTRYAGQTVRLEGMLNTPVLVPA